MVASGYLMELIFIFMNLWTKEMVYSYQVVVISKVSQQYSSECVSTVMLLVFIEGFIGLGNGRSSKVSSCGCGCGCGILHGGNWIHW